MVSRSVLVAFVVALLSARLMSAPTPWDNPDGSTPDYSWSAGENDTGKLSSPIVTPGRFTFTTQRFTATSANGDPAAGNDTFRVHLQATGSKRFSTIEVNVLGDYALLGPASVQASGLLRIINNLTAAIVSVPLTVSPSMPITAGVGLYAGQAQATLPADWKDVVIEFSHNLSSSSNVGSTGHIEAKSVVADVTVVPLPAAVFAAPAGFGVMLIARRRFLRRR